MAEGQDARVHEIRGIHVVGGGKRSDSCAHCYTQWPCDTAYLLARLDALTAERDVLRVERDIARRVEQESSAAADAWQAEAVKVRAERDALTAERDARIKTLENDLEHALASVGAFRQAIEKVFAKADEHEIDQGGMIVTYVLPCGPLHRAIGLARGTDAGGKLLAERDALAARLAAAEAALVAYAELLDYKPFMEFERAFNSILDNESAPSEPDERERWLIRQAWVAAMNVAHDALAGSREQAAGEGANPTSDSGESSRLSE